MIDLFEYIQYGSKVVIFIVQISERQRRERMGLKNKTQDLNHISMSSPFCALRTSNAHWLMALMFAALKKKEVMSLLISLWILHSLKFKNHENAVLN